MVSCECPFLAVAVALGVNMRAAGAGGDSAQFLEIKTNGDRRTIHNAEPFLVV